MWLSDGANPIGQISRQSPISGATELPKVLQRSKTDSSRDSALEQALDATEQAPRPDKRLAGSPVNPVWLLKEPPEALHFLLDIAHA